MTCEPCAVKARAMPARVGLHPDPWQLRFFEQLYIEQFCPHGPGDTLRARRAAGRTRTYTTWRPKR